MRGFLFLSFSSCVSSHIAYDLQSSPTCETFLAILSDSVVFPVPGLAANINFIIDSSVSCNV